MSHESLLAFAKKKTKPYNLVLKLSSSLSATLTLACLNLTTFKYGFTENTVTSNPTVGSTTSGITSFTISIPAGTTKIYLNFPKPAANNTYLRVNNTSFSTLVTEVESWENFTLNHIFFFGLTLLTKVPSTLWPLCTSMASMFYNCSNFNQRLNYDTSKVTNMNGTFSGCSKYNQPVIFNTANVSFMGTMFYGCSSLNQLVSFNDVSKVTDINSMFLGCSVFNQDLSMINFKSAVARNSYDSNCPAWATANKPKFTA